MCSNSSSYHSETAKDVAGYYCPPWKQGFSLLITYGDVFCGGHILGITTPDTERIYSHVIIECLTCNVVLVTKGTMTDVRDAGPSHTGRAGTVHWELQMSEQAIVMQDGRPGAMGGGCRVPEEPRRGTQLLQLSTT